MEQPPQIRTILKKTKDNSINKRVTFVDPTELPPKKFPHMRITRIPADGVFSPDSKHVIIPTKNKVVVYETETGNCLGNLEEFSGKRKYRSHNILFSPRGTYITEAYEKHVWHVANQSLCNTFTDLPTDYHQTTCIGWTPDEKQIVFLKILHQIADHESSYCEFINLQTGCAEKTFQLATTPISRNFGISALAPNGKLLAYGDHKFPIYSECYQKIIELEHGKEKCIIKGGTETQFTPDSRYALVGVIGARLLIIDNNNGSLLRELTCSNEPSRINSEELEWNKIGSLKMNAHRLLVGTIFDRKELAWKIPEGNRLENFEESDMVIPSNNGNFCVKFSSPRRIDLGFMRGYDELCTATLENKDKKTALPLGDLSTWNKSSITFSPPDSSVIIPSSEKNHLLDTKTGALIYSFRRHPSVGDGFKFSPDGKHLIIQKGNQLVELGTII